jgi:MFS family permease
MYCYPITIDSSSNTNTDSLQILTSVQTIRYQLGQAIGGCLLPPYSELVGRRLPYLLSCATFSVFCLLIGMVHSPIAVYVGRFMTGFASAVPSVVIAGSVEDMFNASQRVWIVVLWNAGTTIGLCFGPIYAIYLSEYFGWRWIFYSAAIVTAANLVALFGIQESRPSLLLRRVISRLKDETSLTQLDWHNPDEVPNVKTLINLIIIRPAHILVTEPLVIMVAFISAVSWSMIYLFTESLTEIYERIGFTKTEASLPFLAIAIGVPFTLLPRLWDMKIIRQRRKDKATVEP